MDDRLRESLSAMMDDEADELAVRRVLAHSDNEQMQDQWLRWQRLREQMRGQDARWSSIDVRAGVWDKVETAAPQRAVRTTEPSSPTNSSGLRRPGTAALAAMFVAALALGFGAGQNWSTGEPEAVLANSSGSAVPQQAVAAATVPSVPLQDLDEAQWEQLSDYLLRHAQHNTAAGGHGAVGFARVASVSAGTP